MSDPLSPFSRQLVESARRAHEPGPADKVRVRRSLDARLATVLVVGGSTLLGSLAKATGVMLVAASVVTGTVWVVRANKAPAVHEPAVAPRVAVPSAAPVMPQVSPLEQELALLNEAQAALRAHQPAAALRKLDQHAHSFPEGFMLQERQAARALALCELGRKVQARQIATKFVQSWPASPLVSRMNEVCVPSPSQQGTPPRGR